MSELAQAIEEMRNMRESYDQLATTADLYQQGRTALASAITAKGVPTTADTPLADMAENIGDIQQTTTILQGGEVYGRQLFGNADPTISPLWNLYDVLAQMKSRFMGAGQYAALIVCEYYKGYDSLQLQGADAYYTCDGDFYDTSSPLHVWHDAEDNRENRWVCFLFATEGARLDITNTAISPRSMYIGGHIGTIEYFVDGRLMDLVCGSEPTDTLDYFLPKKFAQNFSRNLILNGIKNLVSLRTDSTGLVYYKQENDQELIPTNQEIYLINAQSAYWVRVDGVKKAAINSDVQLLQVGASTVGVEMKDIEEIRAIISSGSNKCILRIPDYSQLRFIDLSLIKKITGSNIYLIAADNYLNYLTDVIVGEMENHIYLKRWAAANIITDATQKAKLIDNIKNHILARVSDRTGLSQLIFTIASSLYNAISGENIEWQGETMTLADAFLTKNWLLAGA